MSRWASPPVYAHSPAGLALAELDLDRLTAQHAAYAAQPDISPIWQGYIDRKAARVQEQRDIVGHLRTPA